jgi:hypothetical protein
MFVTEKLVYLQLQKTGCTHIVRMMTELVGGELIGRKHGRLEPKFALEGRKIVGSVRDPWGWYVSLWAFGCIQSGTVYASTTSRNFRKHLINRKKYPNHWLGGLWQELVKPTARWSRLYADSDDTSLFREWLTMTLDPRRAHDLGENYGYSTASQYAGLLTYRYARLYASETESLFPPAGLRTLEALQTFDKRHNVASLMIRNEALEDDLISVLKSAGHKINKSAEDKIRSAQKTNTSRHKPTSEYYDAATSELVAQKEAFIIGKYGYKPPINPLP